MIRYVLQLLCVMAGLVLAPMPALAQTSAPPAPAKSFLPTPAQRAAPAAEPAGPLQRAYIWLTAWQAEINRQLASAVRDIRTGNPLLATLVLAGLSFAYGVLHAAGPGHGKAVISSYVLANERTVRRGIALSFLAALIQGLSALVVVAILVLVLKATGLTMKATEAWLETASWALVAAVGAWLLWGSCAACRHKPATAHAHTTHDHAHHAHGHHGHHRSPRARRTTAPAAITRTCPIPSSSKANGPGARRCRSRSRSACGPAPAPSWCWSSPSARACCGPACFATFAMALGTAITVSALAARPWARASWRCASAIGSGGSERVRVAAGIGGSALVMLLGVVFFFGSLNGGTGSA